MVTPFTRGDDADNQIALQGLAALAKLIAMPGIRPRIGIA
jgi:hypothetical protein